MVIYATIGLAIVTLWLQRNSPITKKYQVPLDFVRKVFNCISLLPGQAAYNAGHIVKWQLPFVEQIGACLTVQLARGEQID